MKLHEIGEKIELYFVDLFQEKRTGRLDRIMYGFLFICSRFYRAAVQTRIWMYNKRIIRNHSIGCQVVSIGNLTCGGTGKTPVVEIFARTLQKEGRHVAILSRGYRSKDRRPAKDKFAFNINRENGLMSLIGTPGRNRWGVNGDTGNCKFAMKPQKRKVFLPRVVSDGENLLLGSAIAGDEPFMLASNLKGVVVIVGKDRVTSGLYAVENFHTDTLIMDDGFQYLNLKPHLNILLVDATNPFGNHHVLPRGFLREPIRNLRRAHYIFLTKSDGSNKLRHLKDFIRKRNPHAEIIECTHKPLRLIDVFDKEKQYPLNMLNGKKIGSLCAIANPQSFNKFLVENGAEIVMEKHFADHHRFTQQEMLDVVNNAKQKGAEYILTTEKDAVRMDRLDQRDLPFLYLRIEIAILNGRENFEQCISRICFR